MSQKNTFNPTGRFTRSLSSWFALSALALCLCFATSCEKEILEPETVTAGSTAEHEAQADQESNELNGKKGDIFWPKSGGSCTTSPPRKPLWGAGNSAKKGWHRVVKNQSQFVSAINWVNSRGGTIFLDASFNVTTQLPTITRNNVTILSRSAVKITDKVSGNSRATAMLNVTGANFVMKNVTIIGIGHLSPNNPGSWSGKRSAVSVSGNSSRFERCHIRLFTHAAVRLENGSGHQVLTCTLRDQKLSTLGYGVLLRNNAKNVLIKRCRFDKNSHSVATTGGKQQSYRAEGNWTTNSFKWHFDCHMGPDGFGGNRVDIINNVSNGNGTLLLVRGPFQDGVYVRNNLHNKAAGKLVELKPDATFSQNGTTFAAGNFYSPFGLNQTQARKFFQKGEIRANCVNQNYNSVLASAPW